ARRAFRDLRGSAAMTTATAQPTPTPRGSRLRTLSQKATGALACASALAAFVAQAFIDRGEGSRIALAILGAAAVGFALLTRGLKAEAPGVQASVPAERVRWSWVLAALALAAWAFTRFGGNRLSPEGLLLLIVASMCLVEAVAARSGGAPAERGPQASGWSRIGLHLAWHQVALAGIMLLGAYYRLWRIGEIPAEMGCDLPHNYANIQQILRGEWPIFFPSYPGREGLFFYLAAPVAWLTGLSHTSIKVAGAIAGVVTLPVIYLLGKELYSREVGLYAALLLSVSHWHTIVCRTGYRAATLPLVLGLLWYVLLRAFKTGRRGLYMLAGLFLGLGFYTYNAFMIVPLAVLLVWLAECVRRRERGIGLCLGDAAVFAMAALLVLVPLARYVYEEPGTYFFRAATRLTGVEAPLPADLVGTLTRNFVHALGMFNVRGDSIYASNVPYLRQLGFLAAPLFVLGAAYALVYWRRGHNATVLIVLGVMLLPTALSIAFPDEVPGALRAIGTLLPALLLAALALALLRRHLSALLTGLRGRGPLLASALVVMALGAEARALYPVYFHQYVMSLPSRNYSISLEMARVIDAFAGSGEAYILIAPHWYDGNAIRAQLRQVDLPWANELETLVPGEGPLDGRYGSVLVIVHPSDSRSLDLLWRSFPRGVALSQRNGDGATAFVTFYGEK
ncbi:MAG: ArnT family glycosyltransferase, partial [Anaerolineae bacterium]